jgi:DNA repair exonuclease SbcCD ATPase subunit
MNIILKAIHMENFKIFQNKKIVFSLLTKIFAQNYRGKSSIVDAFFWVLFGKSSTGNSEGKNFHPRRQVDGVDIDRVPVIVELTLMIDEREIVIRKVQEQKWVRKRGNDFETYEGDSNSYFWNEVEVKETEHKKRVAEIIDEDLFKKITNPHAFVTMKQDEQKKFLTEKVAQITDDDVFSLGGFEELRTLTDKNTLEEIKAINKKALAGYKDKQDKIPVQIAERSKDIKDVDFAEQELALSSLNEQLTAVESKIQDTGKAFEGVNSLRVEISETKGKIASIEREEKEKIQNSLWKMKDSVNSAERMLSSKISAKEHIEKDIVLKESCIEGAEKHIASLQDAYKEAKEKEFDAESCTCPTCGQSMPEDKKQDHIAEFEKKKAEEVERIKNQGNAEFAQKKKDEATLDSLKEQITTVNTEIEALTRQKTELSEKLATMPTEIDLSGNKEFQELTASLKALEFSLTETLEFLKDTESVKATLTEEKQSIAKQIDDVKAILASKQHIEDAKDRVAELHNELKQATIEAARCEKLIMTLENFEKSKTALLTERVNQHFKLVKWSFERQQKNGGVEQYCSCSVNGVEYGDNTVSTAQKLMAGLDVINTLQQIYGVKAPIFIDDKEHYNDKNIPEMGCQLIMLSVSDDEELRVEVASD